MNLCNNLTSISYTNNTFNLHKFSTIYRSLLTCNRLQQYKAKYFISFKLINTPDLQVLLIKLPAYSFKQIVIVIVIPIYLHNPKLIAMKKLSVFFLLLFIVLSGTAQPSEKLEENEPKVINGIECTYRINKESTKKSGDSEYSRYVLEFYAINKSDCSKYINYRSDPSVSDNSIDNLIATFFVRNANGKRLTSKDSKVYAKPWWVRVKSNEKDDKGKDVVRLRDMQAGYVFRRGDMLKSQITVLVPMGEKPNVEVALAYIIEN
jgi:hypothetical protein